jgi:membrane protein
VRIARELNTAIRAFFYDRCTQHAAGIAYRVLFALAPLAIVLVWITGIVLRDRDLGDAVTDAIIEFLPVDPSSRDQVLQAVESVASPTSLAGFIALLGLAWTASGIISSIRSGLEQAMRVDERAAIAHRKLVDVVLVVGAGGLVVLLVGLTSLATLVRRWLQPVLDRVGLEGLLTPGVTPIVTGAAAVGVTLVLYRFVPSRRLPFRDALVGAAATGLMTAGIAVASSYVFDAVLEMSSIFGSITTVFVFLYSVYLHACALLLGAEIARVRGLPPAELEHVVPKEVHTVRQWLQSWRARR